mgnify:CR=1 FL=1
MCIRDRNRSWPGSGTGVNLFKEGQPGIRRVLRHRSQRAGAVSYTHLRAHETVLDLVCRLLLEKKKTHKYTAMCIYNTKRHEEHDQTFGATIDS